MGFLRIRNLDTEHIVEAGFALLKNIYINLITNNLLFIVFHWLTPC